MVTEKVRTAAKEAHWSVQCHLIPLAARKERNMVNVFKGIQLRRTLADIALTSSSLNPLPSDFLSFPCGSQFPCEISSLDEKREEDPKTINASLLFRYQTTDGSKEAFYAWFNAFSISRDTENKSFAVTHAWLERSLCLLRWLFEGSMFADYNPREPVTMA